MEGSLSRSRSLAIKCLLTCVMPLVSLAIAHAAKLKNATPDKIFVTNEFGDSVTVYPVGKFGNVKPLITYSNSDALLGCSPDGMALERPSAIAFDASENIYVANDGSSSRGYDSVTVYGYGKSPNAPPIVAICANGEKDKTGFGSPRAIAVDGKGFIYVANFGNGVNFDPSIDIYPPRTNSNVAPTRVIKGAATGLSQPAGLAIDSSGYMYVLNTNGGPVAPGGSITIYAPGAYGNAAPVKTISGTASSDQTCLDNPSALALDTANNIYVTNQGNIDGAGGTDSVTIYRASGDGNVKPTAKISGRLTKLEDPSAIALDAIGNIFVVNSDSITVYPPGSNGNVAPAMRLSNGKLIEYAVITGSLTELNSPSGIAIGHVR